VQWKVGYLGQRLDVQWKVGYLCQRLEFNEK
jgi:hypothetical protein